MKKKLIIFDLDGVLFDTPMLVNSYFLQLYPTVTNAMMKEVLCGNFHEELKKIRLVHKPLAETPEETGIRQKTYTAKKAECLLYGGIYQLLHKLHSSGNILAINTSAHSQNCLPLLEKNEILNLFDTVATAETSDSKTEKFKIIKEKYKMPEEDTLFITDTLGDVREAEMAGIPTIAVTYGAHDRSYFVREPHSNLLKIVDSVEELGRFIDGYLV